MLEPPPVAWTDAQETDVDAETHHRIAFCAGGSHGIGHLKGCALSCPYLVQPRAATIEWSVAPTVLRSLRTSRDTIAPAEATIGLGAANQPTSRPLTALPPTPVVRVLDHDGIGVPGKQLRAYVYVTSAVKAACALEGVALTEAQMEADPIEYACALSEVQAFAINQIKVTSAHDRPGRSEGGPGRSGEVRGGALCPRSTPPDLSSPAAVASRRAL